MSLGSPFLVVINFASSNGIFSVSSVSSWSSRKKTHAWQPLTVSNLNYLWCLDLPSRIAIFAWRFFVSRLPTIDSLIARGIGNISSPRCVLCDDQPESLNHLFFNCEASKKVWEWIYGWIGDKVPFSLEDFKDFQQVHVKVKSTKVRTKIQFIWLSLIWSIWRMRNSRIFEQVLFSFEVVVYNVMFLSWSWLGRIRGSISLPTFYEWYKYPMDCFHNL
ncbi:uncharacterized protein LOC131650962 [Vicia villosa]|uniref:uncharacterized protein LOC131650962 n=1 Tax=Vicia villosa TaxID=3911 RepID=UPI00273AC7F2|nr:uncharacterized protein LOC131650962 [Vicia villosa]